MDGTLIDSTAGVVEAWTYFAETYPGLDVQEVLRSTLHPASGAIRTARLHLLRIIVASHGVRTVDNLRKHCHIEDPEELEV